MNFPQGTAHICVIFFPEARRECLRMINRLLRGNDFLRLFFRSVRLHPFCGVVRRHGFYGHAFRQLLKCRVNRNVKNRRLLDNRRVGFQAVPCDGRDMSYLYSVHYIPSISSLIRLFISAAYSSGSSLDTGLAKPDTIIARASDSLIPRLIR